MPAWTGTKRHPTTVAVKRKKDGNKMVIRAENFDEKLHDLDGDGSVDYDPTETAEDIKRKADEAAAAEARKEEIRETIAEDEPAPRRRGRPRKSE